MKWLLIVVLSLGALVMLVVVVGALLPRKHTASRTVSLYQSPEAVWRLISGPPEWRPDVRKYEELPAHDGRRMWRETDKHGQAITYEAMEATPLRRLVTRIADPKLPFGGSWTFDIVSNGDSCTLTITEDGEVYNPLFRFVSRFIIGHTASIDAYVQALNAKLGA
jgi:uncharacterized protein YndB with AHSA1/START domain